MSGTIESSMGVRARGVAPAVALGVMQTGSAISLAALVYSGDASDRLGPAVASFLLGSIIVSVVLALRSTFETMVASANSSVTVVVAALAVSLLDDVSSDKATTVAAFVAIATLVASVFTYLMGRFNLGDLVRFVPFPVVGGYVAGTGWLMLEGGVEVLVDRRMGIADVTDLFTADLAQFWVPGVLLALAIVFLPGVTGPSILILAAIAGFRIVVNRVSDIETVQEDGWTLGPLPDSNGVGILTPDDLQAVDWSAIAGATPGLAAVTVIAVVGLLLNITGVEAETGENIDVDQELRLSGAASIGSGLFGGTVGYVGIGQTLLARRLQTSSLLVSLSFVGLALVTILVGPNLIGSMPRFVAGALVMAPGIALLHRWFRDGILNGSTTDRILTIVIPITMLFLGVLEGVGLGIAIAAALFVIRYASLNPVRLETTGATMRSNLDRDADAVKTLKAVGSTTFILGLDGFLFFGTAAHIGHRVRSQLESDSEIRNVILDFRQVTGIDSSAQAELQRLLRRCDHDGVHLQFSDLRPDLVETMATNGHRDRIHPDLDRALESVEQSLLAHEDQDASLPLDVPLLEPGLAVHFDTVHVEAGANIITARDEGAPLYIVESGTFTVWVPNISRDRRLRRVARGAFLGEVGFFTGDPATASVTADSDAVVLRMDHATFEDLTETQPAVAWKLTQLVLERTARRLATTNSLINDLLR